MENDAWEVRPIMAAGSPALHRDWVLEVHPERSAPAGYAVPGFGGRSAGRVTVTVSCSGGVVSAVSVTGSRDVDGAGGVEDDDEAATACSSGVPLTPPGRRNR